jgi:hypothetical protein
MLFSDAQAQTHLHRLSGAAAPELKMAFSGGTQKPAQRKVKLAPVFA